MVDPTGRARRAVNGTEALRRATWPHRRHQKPPPKRAIQFEDVERRGIPGKDTDNAPHACRVDVVTAPVDHSMNSSVRTVV